MAARSSTSVLTMVFMALLGVVALTLFVTTIVFASQARQATQDLEDSRAQLVEAVKAEESELFQQLRPQTGNKSVVGYLNDNYQSLAEFAVGRRNRTPEQIQSAFDELLGGDDQYDNLESAITSLINELASTQRELDDARLSAERARTDLANANDALESVRDEFQQAADRQLRTVNQAFDDARAYGADLDDAKSDFQDEVERLKRDAEAVSRQKDRRINDLIDTVSRLEQTIAELSKETIDFGATDESTLADGTIVGTSATGDEVFISLGTQDRLPRSLTFQVYSVGTRIAPDADGNLPRGKATIEVIRRGRDSSVARVIRSARGNSIIEGDVIVNAVYDPDKVYEFVVFGDFDTNRDFISTPRETDDIRAIIREWGGTLSDDIAGTTDFVVLGQRPVLPPEPRPDDPGPIIQAYADARAKQINYDRLFETATATFIPVINQNRLFNLTGIDERR